MRSMRIDVAKFAKEHHEAYTARLTVKEFASLLGISTASLHARWNQCRSRGLALPLLVDQCERAERSEACARRKAEREARKAEREARRQPAKSRKVLPPPAPTATTQPDVNLDALSEQVADKVYARLRDTLRFQFFVGPEVPA